MKIPLNLVRLPLLVVWVAGCASSIEKPASSEDRQAVAKAMKIIQDTAVPDKSAAMVAFKEACDLGNSYSCHQIGMAHVNGLYGMEKSNYLAKRWFLKGAEKGYFPSQLNLANLHALNLVEPKNDLEGYKWIILASRGATACTPDTVGTAGYINAQDAKRVCQLALQRQSQIRSILRNRLSSQELQKAEQLANAWKPL